VCDEREESSFGEESGARTFYYPIESEEAFLDTQAFSVYGE